MAASPPALYIRLARADHAESLRTRTKAAGDRFQSYLSEYTRHGAAPGWQVRDLDDEPKPPGKIADIVIWPDDETFVVIVEAKATLQKFDALLGHPKARQNSIALHQKSFGQIHETAQALGSHGFVPDAPTGVPVFGLTVTLDLHLTSVIDDKTLSGVVLDYVPPTGPSATSPTPSRVVQAKDFEVLADLLAWAPPTDVRAVLTRLFDASHTRGVREILQNEFGNRLPESPPINPLIPQAFDRLADAAQFTPALSDGFRSAAASLRA